jgi:hypothetical protein
LPPSLATPRHQIFVGLGLIDLYDELLVLSFFATNQRPYPFKWLNSNQADLDYGAALAKIGETYQHRFR